MTLIVEDGSGVTNANTYASVNTVDEYHAALGQDTWTGTDAAKEAAILRAMRFIENQQYIGIKEDEYNPLEWPRWDAWDRNGYLIQNDVIPQNIINALCEAALVELVSPNALRATLVRGNAIKRQKVDVIETEYFNSASSRNAYDAITMELGGYTTGNFIGGGRSLSRV